MVIHLVSLKWLPGVVWWVVPYKIVSLLTLCSGVATMMAGVKMICRLLHAHHCPDWNLTDAERERAIAHLVTILGWAGFHWVDT